MSFRKCVTIAAAVVVALLFAGYSAHYSRTIQRSTPDTKWPAAYVQLNGRRSRLPDYYSRLLIRSLLKGPTRLATDETIEVSTPKLQVAGAYYHWLSPGIVLIRDNQKLLYEDPLPNFLKSKSTESADSIVNRFKSLIPIDSVTGRPAVITMPKLHVAVIEPPPERVPLTTRNVQQVVHSILNGPTSVAPDVYIPQIPFAELSFGDIQSYHMWSSGIVLMNEIGVMTYRNPLPIVTE